MYLLAHIYRAAMEIFPKKLTVIAFRERNRKVMGRDERESGFFVVFLPYTLESFMFSTIGMWYLKYF